MNNEPLAIDFVTDTLPIDIPMQTTTPSLPSTTPKIIEEHVKERELPSTVHWYIHQRPELPVIAPTTSTTTTTVATTTTTTTFVPTSTSTSMVFFNVLERGKTRCQFVWNSATIVSSRLVQNFIIIIN